MLEVDRTGGATTATSTCAGAASLAAGQNSIYFSRSTDTGRPSRGRSRLTTGDIGRCRAATSPSSATATSMSPSGRSPRQPEPARRPRLRPLHRRRCSLRPAPVIRNITPYSPSTAEPATAATARSTARLTSCSTVSRSSPGSTADQTGELPGVYLTYNEIRPGSDVASDQLLLLGRPGLVGQSLVYVSARRTTGRRGAHRWPVDPRSPSGHQFFPDIDASTVRWPWCGRTAGPTPPTRCSARSATRATPRVGPSRRAEHRQYFFAHSTNGTTWRPRAGVQPGTPVPVRDVRQPRHPVPR